MSGKDAVIAYAEPQIVTRWSKLFDVAGAICEVVVYGVKDPHSGFAINDGKLGLRILAQMTVFFIREESGRMAS